MNDIKIPLVLVGFVCNSLGRAVYKLPSFFMRKILGRKTFFYFPSFSLKFKLIMMFLKKHLPFFLFLFASFPAFTQTLTVEIKNLKSQLDGTVYLMVVDKNDKPLRQVTRPVSEKNNIFIFKDLATPVCAVRVFHDKNNNGKMDTGFFGQPVEGWGVSNDARGFMSAPPFNKMLLTVSGETKTAIRLDY
jgi:uncharacterized protein (DUF2141 family)